MSLHVNCLFYTVLNTGGVTVMADSYLSPLVQIMTDVMIIIALRQFWLKRIFFGKQALPKNRGAYVDSQNWHQPVNRSDQAV